MKFLLVLLTLLVFTLASAGSVSAGPGTGKTGVQLCLETEEADQCVDLFIENCPLPPPTLFDKYQEWAVCTVNGVIVGLP